MTAYEKTTESFADNEYTAKGDYGWKIHLNVPEDANPLTRELVEFCVRERISYKIGRNDAQIGKGMTLAVGSRDRLAGVAKMLDEEFGACLPETAGEALKDDQRLTDSISARFDLPRGFQATGYGSRGIPFLDADNGPWNQDIPVEVKLKRAMHVLQREFGAYFMGAGGNWLDATLARDAAISLNGSSSR